MTSSILPRIGPHRLDPTSDENRVNLDALKAMAKTDSKNYPEAIELEARLSDTILDGLGKKLSLFFKDKEWLRDDTKKRKRRVSLFLLCAVVMSKHSEAREVACRALSALAAKVGMTLMPTGAEATRVTRAGIDLLHGTTGALSRLEVMLQDDHFSQEEREIALSDVLRIKKLVAIYEVSLLGAPQSMVVGGRA